MSRLLRRIAAALRLSPEQAEIIAKTRFPCC